MSINLINYALAKKDWKKAYEDLKVLEIGGRNLLLNSQGEFITNNWHTPLSFEGERLRRYLGEEITISFSAKKLDGNGSKIDAYLRSNAGPIMEARSPIFSITDIWQRYFFTFTVTSEMIENTIQFAVRSNGYDGTDMFNAGFKEIKIEKGNKATDWTPAPEDINAHPFVAELAESVFRSKQNEERIRNLENAITALGGGS